MEAMNGNRFKIISFFLQFVLDEHCFCLTPHASWACMFTISMQQKSSPQIIRMTLFGLSFPCRSFLFCVHLLSVLDEYFLHSSAGITSGDIIVSDKREWKGNASAIYADCNGKEKAVSKIAMLYFANQPVVYSWDVFGVSLMPKSSWKEAESHSDRSKSEETKIEAIQAHRCAPNKFIDMHGLSIQPHFPHSKT